MKISYNWLKEYLDISLSPEALAELLTDCGLEVEGLGKWQSVEGGMKGFVIGEVKSCAKHPEADRLSVTTVDVGGDRLLSIVCGAPNVEAGQKVVVATVGSMIHLEDQSFEIRKAKIRGEVSEGMICAEDELGLGTDHEGILVLPGSAAVGTPAAEYFRIEEDHVFEIGLTPNRTDAMSHIGVARDIRAVLGNMAFRSGAKSAPAMRMPSVEAFAPDNTTLDIPVVVRNPEACPRYAGVTISGIKVKESPGWLQNRLNAIGLRPINNVVDITNFVLHETGQPLHAFDAGQIKGNRVVVKKMAEGTPFVTLDEAERKLSADDLMICNEEDGMCIGGVFGGLTSGVTEKTTAIFLESAYFDPVHIRKTSKYHDLQTDASFRFERGADPEMTIYALKRAALLIKELAGGTISSEVKDVYPAPFRKVNADVRWKNIDRLTGKAMDRDLVRHILLSLDFDIAAETDEGLNLNVPLYRADVTREADVIEEILRIYGYNNVEIGTQLRASISPAVKPDPEKLKEALSGFLCSNGFSEIMNNSLSRAAYYEGNADFDAGTIVHILNPLSRDLNVMRRTLLYGGLETVIHNQNRKVNDLRLFEFGQVYAADPGVGKDSRVTERYSERLVLSLFITGRMYPESWKSNADEVDLFDLKSICQNLLAMSGIALNTLKYSEDVPAFLQEGIAYGQGAGHLLTMGTVAPAVLRSFDIRQPVHYAEIDMEALLATVAGNEVRFTEIPRFPEVRRDLALLLDKEIPYREVERIAFETERKLLKQVNLFDVYEGKNIEAGKKSYAVSFILQDEEQTLTDKVIDKVMDKLIGAYAHRLGAKIR